MLFSSFSLEWKTLRGERKFTFNPMRFAFKHGYSSLLPSHLLTLAMTSKMDSCSQNDASHTPAELRSKVRMMSGQDESAAGLEVLPSSTSTAAPDPLTVTVTIPVRGLAQRTIYLLQTTSSYTLSLLLQKSMQPSSLLSEQHPPHPQTLPLSVHQQATALVVKSLTAQQSLKATPPSSGLTSWTRHKPYSLTQAQSRSTQSNRVRVTAETEESLRADNNKTQGADTS